MKLAVLTGAGASYGAGKLIPYTPPLGRGLYKELAQRFPHSWGNLPWQYAGLLRKDFELGMQQVWGKRLDLVQEFMIDMACYFSEFEPTDDKTDCYSKLAKKIAEKNNLGQIAFATLNYECILDVAASRAGVKIAYLGYPPVRDNLTIWKLHGACNILPDVDVLNITFVAKSIFDGPIKPVDLPLVRKRYQTDKLAIPPVMCAYMPEKPTQTNSRFIEQSRQEWANWIKEVDTVIIIGVRPVLKEYYVWQPIIESKADILYVGGENGDYSELKSHLNNRFTHLADTFESALDSILKNLDQI